MLNPSSYPAVSFLARQRHHHPTLITINLKPTPLERGLESKEKLIEDREIISVRMVLYLNAICEFKA